MPTISTPSERLTLRSALRHRPLGTESLLEEPPRVARASHPHVREQAQRRATAPASTTTSVDVPAWKQRENPPSSRHSRSLVPAVGLGMLLAIIVVLVGQLLIGWIGNLWNDLHYGYPRTFQVDTVVGHNDSPMHPTHLIALNLKGQIEIIEFPGGDVSHAKVYVGPSFSGPQADLVPVTLRFIDTRHDHQPDMLVLCGGEQLVFRNAQGSFHSPSAVG